MFLAMNIGCRVGQLRVQVGGSGGTLICCHVFFILLEFVDYVVGGDFLFITIEVLILLISRASFLDQSGTLSQTLSIQVGLLRYGRLISIMSSSSNNSSLRFIDLLYSFYGRTIIYGIVESSRNYIEISDDSSIHFIILKLFILYHVLSK
jgi:hypothetical protein